MTKTLYQASLGSDTGFDKLVKATNEKIYSCQSVFPFTLFPDIIKVDQYKIDIIYSIFFFSKSVFTILLKDVRTVKVDSGLFFATLNIEVIGYEKNPTPVRFLPKAAAFKLRDIIMGLVAAKRNKVDLATIDEKTLKADAQKVGSTRENLMSS